MASRVRGRSAPATVLTVLAAALLAPTGCSASAAHPGAPPSPSAPPDAEQVCQDAATGVLPFVQDLQTRDASLRTDAGRYVTCWWTGASLASGATVSVTLEARSVDTGATPAEVESCYAGMRDGMGARESRVGDRQVLDVAGGVVVRDARRCERWHGTPGLGASDVRAMALSRD